MSSGFALPFRYRSDGEYRSVLAFNAPIKRAGTPPLTYHGSLQSVVTRWHGLSQHELAMEDSVPITIGTSTLVEDLVQRP
jgi:hypothetical protein